MKNVPWGCVFAILSVAAGAQRLPDDPAQFIPKTQPCDSLPHPEMSPYICFKQEDTRTFRPVNPIPSPEELQQFEKRQQMLKESLSKKTPSSNNVFPFSIPQRVPFADVEPAPSQPNVAPVPQRQPVNPATGGLDFQFRFNAHHPVQSQSKQIAVQGSTDDGLPNPSLDQCPTLVRLTVADVCAKDRSRPNPECIADLTPLYKRRCMALASQQPVTKPEDCAKKLYNAVSEFCTKNPMPALYDSDADCIAQHLARQCKDKRGQSTAR